MNNINSPAAQFRAYDDYMDRRYGHLHAVPDAPLPTFRTDVAWVMPQPSWWHVTAALVVAGVAGWIVGAL